MTTLPPVQRFETSSGVRVYRIACRVMPYLAARVYLVVGAGPVTLVDTGSGQGESTRNILDGIDSLRGQFGETAALADVKRILLTHGHFDHYGGLPDLLRITEAEVGIHPSERCIVADHAAYRAENQAAVERFLRAAGVPDQQASAFLAPYHRGQTEYPRVAVEKDLEDGRELDGIRVIHTPGHSAGHVCLAIDDVLLCGDHVLPRTIPQQWPESLAPGTGLARYLDSLDKVAQVEGLRLALAGHESVMENVAAHAARLRRAQARRNDRLVGYLQRADRPLSPWEIARAIYQQTRGFYLFLGLADTVARIEYLIEQRVIEPSGAPRDRDVASVDRIELA
ncbi:MAG: MBL fold metallo-hydrolase [Pirellulales bacterium]|nr:MBL fold metallo-hydrolase [Pirellulales bacterium]